MSVHRDSERGTSPLSTQDIRQAKGRHKLTMVTAYDYAFARIVDQAGIDMVLVGDSLGMVMLGHEDTLSVTLDDMIHHSKAVVRGVDHALVVADMPFMTYEPGTEAALANAARLLRESGVRAVKVEGGTHVRAQVQALTDAGIPVMGHIGLTPQRSAQLGGFKVQGKDADVAAFLSEEARVLQDAGCFALVLEAIPFQLARLITQRVDIPTIGIGAGPYCDGQVLVSYDMLGLYGDFTPRFVKRYAELGDQAGQAVRDYIEEVRSGVFPAPEHGFTMNEDELSRLEDLLR